MSQRQFALESGRAIGVSASGDPLATRLVLFFHPTPGAGGFDPNPTVTGRWGVRLIALDRPGCGGSDPLASGTAVSVQGIADDAAQFLQTSEKIARELSNGDYGRVGVVGWGIGGAIALSLAARYPDLIDRVATVGLGRPASLEDELRERVDWRQKPSVFDTSATDFLTLLEVPDAGASRAMLFADPAAAQYLGLDHRLERMIGEGLTSGAAGVATDLAAARDTSWASELGKVKADTVLIYGERDEVVANPNGRWYRNRIKGARVVTVEDAGRLAIVVAWRRILAHVAPDGREALGSRLAS